MAKAVDQSSVWLPLDKALKLAVGVYLSRTLAQQRLGETFAEAALGTDWRYKHAQDVTSPSDFWRHPGAIMDVTDNSAWRPEVHPTEATVVRATIYGIEIEETYLKQVFGLLPVTDKWLAATAKQIIESGGPDTLRPLAAKIHPLMVEAVKAGANIELLEEGTLRNRLAPVMRELRAKLSPDPNDSE